MLGAAESGKSTICRHVRGIHGDHFSEEEILYFKRHIRVSSLYIFVNIIKGFLQDNMEETLSHHLCVEFLEEYRSRSSNEYGREFLETAVHLWRFYSIQKYMLKIINPPVDGNVSGFVMPTRTYSDNPSTQFLPSFSRIMGKGYKPTLDDILTVRIPTIGKNYFIRFIIVTALNKMQLISLRSFILILITFQVSKRPFSRGALVFSVL